MQRQTALHTARRPALACSLAFVAGVAACFGVDPGVAGVGTVLFVIALPLFVRVSLLGLVLMLGLAGLGWLRCHLAMLPDPADLRLHPDSHGPVILYGKTAGEADVRESETRWVFEADSVAYPDSVAARTGRLLARFRFDPGIPPDSRVKLAGRILPPEAAQNPGDFSWREYFRRKGLACQFEPADGSPVLHVDSGSGWRSRVVAPLRSWIKDRLALHLEGEVLSLAAGILLGEREQIPKPTLSAFRQTGTFHLLAVSGSNVGVVAAVAWGLLQFLRFPRVARLAGTAGSVILFCYLAHAEASVVRATLASLFVLSAWAIRRRLDPLNLWGLALLLFVAWQPEVLLDVGFQLSFAATLGILLLPDAALGTAFGMTPWRLMKTSLLVSLAAQVGTLPILLSEFGEVPLVSPLANLACVPLAGLATAAATLTAVLAPLGEPVLGLVSGTLWLCLRALLWCVHTIAGLAIPAIVCPKPSGVELLLGWGVVLAFFVALNRGAWQRRLIVLGVALAAALAAFPRPPSRPEAVVLDRQDLTALVRLSSGEVWQVGGAEDRSRQAASKAVQNLGWSQPVGHVQLKAMPEGVAVSAVSATPCTQPMMAFTDRVQELVFWCDPGDSLPFAAVVSHAGQRVVFCTHMPGDSTIRASPKGTLWITDRRTSERLLANSEMPYRMILCGSAGPETARGSAHILNTRRHGAQRILWRDRGFETEPCVR